MQVSNGEIISNDDDDDDNDDIYCRNFCVYVNNKHNVKAKWHEIGTTNGSPKIA